MNTMKQVLFGIFLIVLFSGSALAAELTGREIALKMDAVDTSEDSKRTAIMVISRKGSKTLMQYDNVDYNIGLSDSLFEQSNLKR